MTRRIGVVAGRSGGGSRVNVVLESPAGAAPPDRAPVRGTLLREVVPPFAATLAAGVVLGPLWRVAGSFASSRADLGERFVAVDGSFFVLAAALGVLTAAALWARPGPNPALRLAAVLLGSLAGSLIAVAIGVLLGSPALVAWAAVTTWPWVCAMLVALVSAVRLLVPQDRADGEVSPDHSPSQPA